MASRSFAGRLRETLDVEFSVITIKLNLTGRFETSGSTGKWTMLRTLGINDHFIPEKFKCNVRSLEPLGVIHCIHKGNMQFT